MRKLIPTSQLEAITMAYWEACHMLAADPDNDGAVAFLRSQAAYCPHDALATACKGALDRYIPQTRLWA